VLVKELLSSAKMPEAYSIKSRAHTCHITGKAFEAEQAFIAALFPDPESSSYLRYDYSLEAWDARESDADVPFSHWRSLYQVEEKPEKIEVKRSFHPRRHA